MNKPQVDMRAFQCTGDQVRVAYEMIFEKEMRPASEATEATEDQEATQAVPEMTYEEAIAEMVAQYGHEKIHKVVHAVPHDQFKSVIVDGKTKTVWYQYSEEEKREAITDLVNKL